MKGNVDFAAMVSPCKTDLLCFLLNNTLISLFHNEFKDVKGNVDFHAMVGSDGFKVVVM